MSGSHRQSADDLDLTPEQAEDILRQLIHSPSLIPEAGFPLPLPGVEPPPPPAPEPREAGKPQNLSGDRFHSLLEAVPDGLLIVDQTGTIVLVNAQLERLFGYTREELLGQPIEVLVPERFRGGHVARRNRYFREPRTRPMGQTLQLFGRRKSGQEFPVEISLSPMEAEEGLLVIGTVRDITERQRTEAQLRKAETRYRTLVEEIPAVTFMAALDEGGSELYVSPQIEQLLGFSQKEWLENPVLWYCQLHPDDKERWNAHFAPTCVAGQAYQGVYRFFAKDGRIVWVHGSARVVHNAEGEPVLLQGIGFDITSIKEAEEERKHHEAELRRLNAELERRVQERTEALARSLEEVQNEKQELQTFAHFASHDLKEPLRTLKNYPKLLIRRHAEMVDLAADDFMQRIMAGADNMQKMLDAMSDYARAVDTGQQFAAIDCAQAFARACGNLEARILESGAAVTSDGLPIVQGNETMLTLLFQNLIGNAVKFRVPDRPIQVHVGAVREADDWLFSVRDNGIGIEPEYLERMFKEIGQEARLHKRLKYEGTGLGLAICKKIVERHGGRIWVASEPGHGSTFCFTIPAAADPAGGT